MRLKSTSLPAAAGGAQRPQEHARSSGPAVGRTLLRGARGHAGCAARREGAETRRAPPGVRSDPFRGRESEHGTPPARMPPARRAHGGGGSAPPPGTTGRGVSRHVTRRCSTVLGSAEWRSPNPQRFGLPAYESLTLHHHIFLALALRLASLWTYGDTGGRFPGCLRSPLRDKRGRHCPAPPPAG